MLDRPVLAVALLGGEIKPVADIGDLGRPTLLFLEAPDQAANALEAGLIGFGGALANVWNARAQCLPELLNLAVAIAVRGELDIGAGGIGDRAQRAVEGGNTFAVLGSLLVER